MISNIRFNEIINTFHKGTFPLAVPLSVCCKMCKSPLTMSWTAEIGSWRSVRPHQCWESWSVQSATYIYFRSFTDDSPENETNLDLNPRLNKVFFLINSEGGVVRKVVVTLHHKQAVGLQEIFFQGKHFSSFLFFLFVWLFWAARIQNQTQNTFLVREVATIWKLVTPAIHADTSAWSHLTFARCFCSSQASSFIWLSSPIFPCCCTNLKKIFMRGDLDPGPITVYSDSVTHWLTE